MSTFRVAAIQTRPVFGDVEGNVARATALAERVRPRADLYVFPELMTSGYVFVARSEAMALAETPGAHPAHAPGLTALGAWAKARGAWACAGFPEKDGARVYNSAALIAPNGRVADVYRKIHLFDEEKLWFQPGDREPRVTRVGPARVGMLVCYDWRFPEIARVLALAGADVIAHPSNLVVPKFAQQAMRVRALENRVYAVTANRVGEDVRPRKRLGFTGRSQIVGVNGELLAAAPARAPRALAATLDLARARDKTFTPRNDLFGDRRPELYEPVAERVAPTRRAGRHAMSDATLRPVGVIRSELKTRAEAPKQGNEGAPDAWIEIEPWAADALLRVNVGDALIVLTWLDRAKRDVMQVHPRSDPNRALHGVFATRSPDRPNPIGLHPVTVLAIEGTRLLVGPIEAIDGTPVVDLKPDRC